jgi:hypothetical protein
MKRLVISSTIAALVAGGAGLAFAGQPGPNGHNDFGLCQAYFSGSANGQAHKHSAPPFAALEDTANAAYPNASSTEDAVAQYCANVTPGGK